MPMVERLHPFTGMVLWISGKHPTHGGKRFLIESWWGDSELVYGKVEPGAYSALISKDDIECCSPEARKGNARNAR